MDNQQSEEQQSEKRVEKLEKSTFDISFQHEGKSYSGWATPSPKKDEEGETKSYHVVLNEVFFGNLSFNNDQWEADTQRENGLIQATGKQIEKHTV